MKPHPIDAANLRSARERLVDRPPQHTGRALAEDLLLRERHGKPLNAAQRAFLEAQRLPGAAR